MSETEELLQRAADAAYAAYFPATIDRTSKGLPAYSGDPTKNPLLRPLRKALEVLEPDDPAEARSDGLTELERQFILNAIEEWDGYGETSYAIYERRGDLEASVIRKLDLESVRDKSLDSGGE